MLKSLVTIAVMMTAGSPSSSATDLNMPVATRVISFLRPSPTGTVAAAILYQPENSASKAEAIAIEQSITSGTAVGRSVLRARRVTVDEMGSLSEYKVAFVTTGLRRDQVEIAAAAARSSVLTISSDTSCVESARCVVGIMSSPRTQIIVNRAAARAANIRFGSAFLMLVREI